MAALQKKISVGDLKVGMYVSNLDRPWCETPFPLQGFYIRSDRDVQELERYCKHAFVDVKSIQKDDFEPHRVMPLKKGANRSPRVSPKREGTVVELPPIRIRNPVKYEATTSLKIEVKSATKVREEMYGALENLHKNTLNGKALNIKEIARVAGTMVDTVIRNPDALVWLSRLDDHHSRSFRHSVNASVWALVFGRHLGLDKALLTQLSAGVMLSHVGKSRLNQLLLDKALEELTEPEVTEYRKYVDYSVEMIEKTGNIPKSIISVIQFHQERHNGTGYPLGAMGDHIPLLAKIGGLVDYYQCLIEPTSMSRALSSAEAVSRLYELRNIKFQADLVERFIQAVGVYPTGTLVELDNQEVAVVIGHNQTRRLLPKVMVVLNADKQPCKPAKIVDLKEWNDSKKVKTTIKIKGCLAKGSYNINVSDYLVSGATSKWSLRHLFAS